MKPQRTLLILLSLIFGCTHEPQTTTTRSPASPATTPIQEVEKPIRDDEELIVIGQVIGTQSDHVSQLLQQAGINCSIQGDEFHDIAVPRKNAQAAIDIVAEDSRKTGHEVIWTMPESLRPGVDESP